MNPRMGVQAGHDLHRPVQTPAQHERSPASRFSGAVKKYIGYTLLGASLVFGVSAPLSSARAQDTEMVARVAPVITLDTLKPVALADMQCCGEQPSLLILFS